jgi:hypothetical protein
MLRGLAPSPSVVRGSSSEGEEERNFSICHTIRSNLLSDSEHPALELASLALCLTSKVRPILEHAWERNGSRHYASAGLPRLL